MSLPVPEFFEDEYPEFAIYNLYRMVASYVDGMKPSQRKIIYTMIKNNIKSPMKVSQLASKVAEQTQYLHGEQNLTSVVVGLAQDFCGTNNINLINPDSSFGNRCIPEAAAGRYIFTNKTAWFDSIFDSRDMPLLTEQVFEGDVIEPRFFVPTIPVILVNGSVGIGSGWSQTILPRNPKTLEKTIREYFETGEVGTKRLPPYFKGFKGKIKHIEDRSWEIHGVFQKINTTTIKITELPIGITLDKYTEILTKMEDAGTITTFTDFSDPGENRFEFEVKVTRAVWGKKSDDKIMRDLKLVKRVTENFTCMDENNTVREFKSELEILEAYIKMRGVYYDLRRADQMDLINRKLNIARNRAKFVKEIIQDKLVLKRKTKNQIYAMMKSGGPRYDLVDESFDYLLNMPIHSFSKETIQKLKDDVKKHEAVRADLETKTGADLWLEDLDNARY